ncbi:MAG TPA: hypothetical protein VGK94_09900 [Candidatus Polarisedimenticolia bacterium]|jgi:hypothetical protein
MAAAVVACLMVPAAPGAEDKILIEGLADAEVWDTGTRSLNLTRNDGDTATQRRLRLWTGAQFTPRFQALLLGRVEGGDANGYLGAEGTQTKLEQAWVRYSFAGPVPLVLQAGRMVAPIGGYTRRYLSSQNPLIGSPANYDVSYPYGIELAGSAGRADFMAAVVDKPVSRQIYLPEPSSSPRPALAAGVTLMTGFRLGAYATWGPYLAREVEGYLPPGTRWRDFRQRVLGFDLQFSRGHFELNGELTKTLFEVPGQNDDSGVVYYLEPRYAWSPRWFSALRVERNRQASVWLPYMAGWYVTDDRSWDVEAGAGFRIDPHTVLKVSYRVEREDSGPASSPVVDHALAVQLSCGFDVRSWFERPR